MSESCMLWPVRREDLAITSEASTYAIRVERSTTETLTIGPFTADADYYFRGDGSADDLCEILKDALNTHTGAGAGFTVSLTARNVITVSHASNFKLLWGDGATTLKSIPFGFAQTNSLISNSSQVAATQTRGIWAPRRHPSFDTEEQPRYAIGAAVALSGRQRVSRYVEAKVERRIVYELLERKYARNFAAEVAEPTNTVEDAWEYALTLGREIEWYDDASDRSAEAVYVLAAEAYRTGNLDDVLQKDQANRLRYTATFQFRGIA